MHQKTEIVKKFSEKKYLLSEEALEILLKKDWEKVYLSLPKSETFKILKKEDIEKILEKTEEKEIKIEQLINFEKRDSEVSIFSFLNILKERYSYFYKVLQKKYFLKPTSISKISNQNNFFLIGMVKEIKSKSIIIEDLTGSIEVFISDENLILDSVIGLECEKKEKIFGKKIYFLDNNSTNQINLKVKVKALENKFLLNSNEINLIEGFNFLRIENCNFLFLSSNFNNLENKILKNRLIPIEIKTLLKYKNDIAILKNDIDYLISISEKFELKKYNNTLIIKLPLNKSVTIFKKEVCEN